MCGRGMRTRIAAVLILASGAGLAQDPPLWRFWEARDGMPETYTHTLSLDSQHRLWATHGTMTEEISGNDGYDVRNIPSPGHFTRILAGPGDTWALSAAGEVSF